MILIAALIGILVVFAMWRFLDPHDDNQSPTRTDVPRPPRPKLPVRSRQSAPDDDPEFLRQLSSKMPKRPSTPPEDAE